MSFPKFYFEYNQTAQLQQLQNNLTSLNNELQQCHKDNKTLNDSLIKLDQSNAEQVKECDKNTT